MSRDEAIRGVAVVGAGPAGLAAAWRLVRAGRAVTIYEREGRAGGRLRSEELDGAIVDPAVQFLSSHFGETLTLLERAGLKGALVRSPGRDALWRRGGAHPLRYGSVTSMAASSALPAGLKLRLAARYLSFLRRHSAHLDLGDPVRAAAAGLDEESIEAWGNRELGRDFVDLLVRPLVAAYYGSDPSEISAGFYHALSAAGLDVTLYAARGGMGALGEGLRAALESKGVAYRGGLEVAALAADGDTVEVRGPWGSARHEAVVLAVPPRAAEAVLPPDAPVLRWLKGVRTRATATLALEIHPPLGWDWFALAFPPGEEVGRTVAAVAQLERKEAGHVPEGRSVLLVFPAPEVAERVAEAGSEDALEILLRPLESVVPGLRARVKRGRVYPMPEGHSLFPAGGLRHRAEFTPALLPLGIWLAGDYLVSPTVEGAVRSGSAAADAVIGEVAA